jgi:mxaJ protein
MTPSCTELIARRWQSSLLLGTLPNWRSSLACVLAAASFAALPAHAGSADAPEQKVLRVCQDPNNMPFSSRDQSGFENKIAALFAADLGWKLETLWSPQRMGFLRNTLRAKVPNSDAYKCDLATSVPFEKGSSTLAYYHSTYSMTYLKGKGLDGVKTLDDLLKLDPVKRRALRFGVFARSPVSDWLLHNGLLEQIVSYQTQTGDPEQYPGQVVEQDLVNGKIDVAFIWGPIAGYFASKSSNGAVVAMPLASRPGLQFDFSIAMGVRRGDDDFKALIDGLIVKNRDQINAILSSYGVPLLDDSGALVSGFAPALAPALAPHFVAR